MPANLYLQQITCVLLIDSDSNRLLAKYYQPAQMDAKAPAPSGSTKHALHSLKDQRAFEQAIWDKTRRASGQCTVNHGLLGEESACADTGRQCAPTGDILLYNNHLVLYKPSIDLTFYVVGPEGENELMLQGVLNAFYDAVSLLLRHQVEKRAILENLDLVVLALDETVDNGIILETDAIAIASRVSRPRPDAGVNLSDITLNEQTLLAAFSSVRDRLGQRILS
ncbi:BQ5605_C037g11598 [Microbotryum silenes-dioicae]|uniref:Coatomer subunit zeta n=1 Tax=Microbotryum silenes-dioicae TaxID=796604 RepID=A0A2X0PGW6_9BASI|nr:BQ5605_C037g11598 [Microbotryum silenes-dioicae]